MRPYTSIVPLITLIGCDVTGALSPDATVDEPSAMAISYEGSISEFLPAASDEAPVLVISLLDADAADDVACELLFELDQDVAIAVRSGVAAWNLFWGFRLEERFAGALGACGQLDVVAWADDLAADLDDLTIGFTHDDGETLVTWADLGDGLVPTGEASGYAILPDGLLASDGEGLPVALTFEDTLAIPDGYYRSVPTATFLIGE